MKRNSLSKIERICLRKDFDNLFDRNANNKTFGMPPYYVIIRENGLDISRIAATAKRNLFNSVLRNREKRIVREIFRTNKDKIKKGFDYIVIITRNVDLSYAKRKSILLSIFDKVVTK